MIASRTIQHFQRTAPLIDCFAINCRAVHGLFRESELLRHLFETTVTRCIVEGLVSGQRMAVDASLIEADANKQNSTPKEDWDAASIDPADAPRAVREYLDTLDEAAFGAASEVQPKFTSHSDPGERQVRPGSRLDDR